MCRTCEPISIANQILQATSRVVDAGAGSLAWQQAARREFSRYTSGLHDFEREQVRLAMTAQTRNRL
jgi:hypothetical protein